MHSLATTPSSLLSSKSCLFSVSFHSFQSIAPKQLIRVTRDHHAAYSSMYSGKKCRRFPRLLYVPHTSHSNSLASSLGSILKLHLQTDNFLLLPPLHLQSKPPSFYLQIITVACRFLMPTFAELQFLLHQGSRVSVLKSRSNK